ncbi:MAG: hypothetical protein LH618_11170, partial [Saprospiraceae bacterium]|nr:hypothetical protein [Saprospiraceae bacterium]
IESYFRKHHIDYIEEICQKLPNFMPEHASKKIYGIAIFAQGDQNAIDLATQRGIYTVQSNYDTYTLRSPKHFVPRDFGQAY